MGGLATHHVPTTSARPLVTLGNAQAGGLLRSIRTRGNIHTPSLHDAYSPTAKTSADYIARINAIKTNYLDAKWNADGGTNNWYTTNSQGLGYYVPYTWFNAFLVECIAVLAGVGSASTQDKTRARQVIDKLIVSPCYSSNRWSHSMAGVAQDTPLLYDSTVDAAVNECFYYAYKYRVELELTAGVITSLYNLLTTNVATNAYPDGYNLVNTASRNGQNLAKWQTNRITYAYLTGNTSLASALSVGMKRFVYYMDKTVDGGGSNNTTHFLFPDFGWRYIDIMEFHSLEYGSMAVGGSMLFYPEISAAVGLTSAEILMFKAWQRHIFGLWQKNGYPNWDTGWSNGRMHSLNYWLWSIRFLLATARNSDLNMNATDAAQAKALLDHSIDTIAYMDTWQSDPVDSAVAGQPMGIRFPADNYDGAIKYTNVKETGMAKYVMELALAVEMGVADMTASEPTHVWGWNWFSQDVHISTPYYSAASLPWAPLINAPGWSSDAVQGPGDGISRLQLPTNEILTNLGGYNQEAFSFKIVRNGTTEINTGDIAAGKPASQQIWRDGVEQTRIDYDTQTIPTGFNNSIKSLVKRTGTNYRSEVETEFFNNQITWAHRSYLIGTSGTGQVVISMPCVKNVVIDYVSTAGNKTVVWNGTTAIPAGSPDPANCRYIHLKWAQWNAGILLTPTAGVVASDAKVTVSSTYPSAYPRRQPNQDRTLLIYLADSAANMIDTSLSFTVQITNGID